MERAILHCDLNAFFASVEEVRNSELKKYPIAVCGNPERRHGIILAKNEKAKAYGVKTAETIWQAKRKCPDLLLVPPHYSEYSAYSKRVHEIFLRYTDLVEPFGIDESWLDVTGSAHLFGTPKEIADDIRRVIKEETGLTASVGVSFTKSFAKLGSDYKKPDATTVISRENFKEIAWKLPARDLLFVGRSSIKVFDRLGIETIGDLARSRRETLSMLLGKTGELIHDYANGIDNSPVQSAFFESDPKSISRGTTFPRNLTDMEDIKTGIALLSDNVSMRLRRHGMKAYCIALTIRDPSFKTVSHQTTLDCPTHLESEITEACLRLYDTFFSKNGLPVRMITVSATNLVDTDDAGEEQISMFSDGKDKKKHENIEFAVDEIRKRFGGKSMTRASFLNSDFSIREKGD